jgi:hypothetical protein
VLGLGQAKRYKWKDKHRDTEHRSRSEQRNLLHIFGLEELVAQQPTYQWSEAAENKFEVEVAKRQIRQLISKISQPKGNNEENGDVS